jgi:uncharacterized membrane protein
MLKKVIGYIRKDNDKIRDLFFQDQSASLNRRRKIVLISLFGVGNAVIITLYQTGIIKKLPDLPLKSFDSEKLTSSEKAFEFGMPDAPGAALLYSLIMVLATYGGARKFKRAFLFDKLLLGATVVNAAFAVQYFYNMIAKQKKLCVYCIAVTLANLSMLPFSWTEFNLSRKGRLV